MGLFNFVTKAGSKLGGKIFDWTHDEIDLTKAEEIQQEKIDDMRAKSIIENIEESGVDIEGLDVKVEGENVTLGGKVKNQENYEKLSLVAGNQYGIGSVNSMLDVAEPEPESTIYTVQSGDTLSKIAKKFYGSASKYPVIFEANKPMLTDPDKIYVGQNLRIPPQ